MPALHALHHPLHVLKLLQKPVHVLHLYPSAAGNAPAPRAVNDRRMAPLARRHGIDDGDLAAHRPITLIRGHGAPPGCRRQLVEQRPHAAELLDLFELAFQIRQVKALAARHFLRKAGGLVGRHLALDLLDQAHDVAHAEDP